jgi:hypothetical protein
MNKDKINSKIEGLEAELQKLKQLANEPKQRTPEHGDVWEGFSGSDWLVGESKTTLLFDTEGTHEVGYHMYSQLNPTGATYLGKFDEVYVKIADVREALSHKDSFGGCILRSLLGRGLGVSGLDKSREALRKLNIITD